MITITTLALAFTGLVFDVSPAKVNSTDVVIPYELVGLDYSSLPACGDLLNLNSIYKISSLMSGMNSSAASVVTNVDFKDTTYPVYLYGLQSERACTLYTSNTLQVENTSLDVWFSLDVTKSVTLNTNLIENYTWGGLLCSSSPNVQISYGSLEYLNVLLDNAVTGKPIQGYSIGITTPGIVAALSTGETQEITLIQFWS